MKSRNHKEVPMKKSLLILLPALLWLLCWIGIADAMTVTLTCDPNTETDLAGYRLYVGTVNGGPYTLHKSYPYGPNVVPSMATNTLPDVVTYIVATAYNTTGQESGYSNQVTVNPPAPNPCVYTYSDWSPAVCPSTGTQTRTVISSTPAGCTGTPVLSQTCVYVPPPFTNVSKTGWKLLAVDSEETVDEQDQAITAFDGNTATFWHSRYTPTDAPLPHWIKIDLGAIYDLDGFKYLPRQDGGANGRIGQYSFYVSMDGLAWGSAVASGAFANTAVEKTVSFPKTRGQYVQLIATTEAGGNGPWSSAAEISLSGILVSAPSVPCVYTYSPWTPTVCPPSGIQTRTVTSSPAGCVGTPDALTQPCTYVPPPPATPKTLRLTVSGQIIMSDGSSQPFTSLDLAVNPDGTVVLK
jgi:hypothetical protein